MKHLTDIEIAQSTELLPIGDIARAAGVDEKYVEQYGRYKAKIDLSLLADTARPDGKEAYEMYLMNWCGPNQEAFFTHLAREAVTALSRSVVSGS